MIGVDDCAKSNWIGPIFLCGVRVKSLAQIPEGVKDCKLLSKKAVKRIKEEAQQRGIKYVIEKIEPEDFKTEVVTATLKKRIASILISLEPTQRELIYIDYMGISLDDLLKFYKLRRGKFIYEAKADSKYPVCSLASVIAKSYRDSWFESLNLPFSDYNYKVLDNLSVEEISSLPVRHRWVLSYLKRKGFSEKFQRLKEIWSM